jgi:putative membrane protein
MAKPFLTDEAKAALTAAVKAVELRTCAEVVIVVRAQSGSYLHADALAGALAGIATLTLLLFSPWEFALHYFVIDPIVVGALVGWFASRTSALRRLLTPRRMIDAAVTTHAHATFHERGIGHTSDRVGILVYISLLERRAEVVADRGVEKAADAGAWKPLCERIADAVARGEDGLAVAKIIERIGDVLEPCLPRAADDVNELPDEVA